MTDLRVLHGGPELAPPWQALWQRHSSGQTVASVTLRGLDPPKRSALADLLGLDRTPPGGDDCSGRDAGRRAALWGLAGAARGRPHPASARVVGGRGATGRSARRIRHKARDLLGQALAVLPEQPSDGRPLPACAGAAVITLAQLKAHGPLAVTTPCVRGRELVRSPGTCPA